MDNPNICWTPLIKKCNYGEAHNGDTKLMPSDKKESELIEWFYMGMGVNLIYFILFVDKKTQ
jgi:hypothetical protein